jgi:hypothetical protein
MAELAEKTAVGTAVAVLAEAFNRKATKPMAEAYRIGLSGLTAEQITTATARALQSCKFMPTPAELRELSGESRLSDRAEQAWAIFERTVTRVGGYKSVCFDDPCLNHTVLSLGGWSACCEMPATEFDTFLRQKFLKAYEAAVRTKSAASTLTGTYAKENAKLGMSGHPLAPGAVLIATGLPALPGLPLIARLSAPQKALPVQTPRLRSPHEEDAA